MATPMPNSPGLTATSSTYDSAAARPLMKRSLGPFHQRPGCGPLFLQLAAEADLFVIWRLGPYVLRGRYLGLGTESHILPLASGLGLISPLS